MNQFSAWLPCAASFNNISPRSSIPWKACSKDCARALPAPSAKPSLTPSMKSSTVSVKCPEALLPGPYGKSGNRHPGTIRINLTGMMNPRTIDTGRTMRFRPRHRRRAGADL